MSEAYDSQESLSNDRAGRVARMKAERSAAQKPRTKRAQKKGAPKAAKKRAQKPTVRADSADRPWRSVALGLVLLGVCVAFGVQAATQSQRMRTLYSQLQQDTLAKDALLAQQSRLLIERGALKSYNSVDRLAEDELKMRFPESITRVTREVNK